MLARRAAPSVEEAHAEGTLVLVIDDHPVNRLVLKRQVTALGYASEEAQDGREGLEKWRSGRFGLVITDCNMPEMDGYELARAIRDEERGRPVPPTIIIACTANALKGEAENCFAAGMNDYIPKPVQLPKLLEKLDHWLPIPADGAAAKAAVEAAAATGDDAAPIDRSVLAQASGGDAELEREMLEQFRRFNAGDVARLAEAREGRDLEGVIHAAHRIKGAARTLGAMRLGAACERIEAAAREGDWEAVAGLRDALEAELVRVERYVETAAAGPSGAASRVTSQASSPSE
jgi:CheY-like chemotaxis protein/HPt (histidine-containing phosphotransfer) domain-containing protein